MRNRAKCKLCGHVLESLAQYDYVACSCGEISISGGPVTLEAGAKHWENFLRLDDQDNEIIVTVKGEKQEDVKPLDKPTRDEMLKMLEEMVKSIEALPQAAMATPVNQYDLQSLLLLLLSILRPDKACGK